MEDEKDYTVSHEFFIAGVQHHRINDVLHKMEEGNNLLLVPEPTNPYDPNAVRIEYATFEEQTMIGYVPKKFSSEVSAAIVIGKPLECVVTLLNKSAKPWEMCKVEIREVNEG